MLLNLFGPGGSGDAATVNVLPGGVGGAGGDATIDLFGPGGGTDPTQTGGIGGNGGAGGGGGAGASGGGGANGVIVRPGGNSGVRVAATGNARVNANCFSPDDAQIAHLVNRNTYSASSTASWQSAARVNLVPVELCADDRARIAAAINADADAGHMKAAVASNAKIRGALGSRGPEDVLAVDQSGDSLTVYVY